jgi:hypothetical protein
MKACGGTKGTLSLECIECKYHATVLHQKRHWGSRLSAHLGTRVDVLTEEIIPISVENKIPSLQAISGLVAERLPFKISTSVRHAGAQLVEALCYVQAGRSRIQLPIRALDFSIELILPAALWPWGRLT